MITKKVTQRLAGSTILIVLIFVASFVLLKMISRTPVGIQSVSFGNATEGPSVASPASSAKPKDLDLDESHTFKLFGSKIPLPNKAANAAMSEQLKSSDVGQIDLAVVCLKSWIAGGRVSPDLIYKWLPLLMARGRYEDVAEIAQAGILTRPEVKFIDQLSIFRIHALIELKKYDLALVTAKVFYNACSIGQTIAALDLLERCISLSDPSHEEVGQQFRREQLSVLLKPTARYHSLIATNLFKDVKVSCFVTPEAKQYWAAASGSGQFRDGMSLANILLLDSQNAEAIDVLNSLVPLAISLQDQDELAEGFARAKRVASTSDREDGLRKVVPNNRLSRNVFDPVVIVQSLQPNDPELLDWLLHWRELVLMGQNVSVQDEYKLNNILLRTRLRSVDLINLSICLADLSRDLLTAGTLCIRGVELGHLQLERQEMSEADARITLLGLHKAKLLLWKIIDAGDRDPRWVLPLHSLNVDLQKYIRPGDVGLADVRIHGIIGQIESACVLQNNDEAIEIAQKIDTSSFNDDEKAAIAWALGVALSQQHRDSEAVAQFQFAAAQQGFKHSEQAAKMLALSLKNANQTINAKLAFEQWVNRYDPPIEEAARIWSQIK